uniref:Uncharacterized protein n=1 Tax=Arundo donax TaxID=35708 RepID=A0A0A9E2M4_ARUDO
MRTNREKSSAQTIAFHMNCNLLQLHMVSITFCWPVPTRLQHVSTEDK